MGSVLRSWLPDLASLVTASVTSHTITQRIHLAISMGINKIPAKTKISSQFVKGFTIRPTKKIPLGTLARWSLWLVPIPGWRVVKAGGVMQKVFRVSKRPRVSSTAPTARGHFLRDTMGSQRSEFVSPPQKWAWLNTLKSSVLSVLNLSIFFRAEEFFTKYIFNVGEDYIRARELANTIENFERHFNDNPHRPHVTCKYDFQNNPKSCRYHPRIVSLIKIGNSFNRWRLHKIEEVEEASNELG